MAAAKYLLFLCTGNYYRSRFAEVLFNSVVKKMGLPWTASSRGLALERGVNNVGPMSTLAVDALKQRGFSAHLDALTRFPLQVTSEELERARYIVALKEAEHRPLLLERFPGFVDKVEFWHVDDAPHVLDLIEREVMNLTARLISGRKRQEPEADLPPEEAPIGKQKSAGARHTVRVRRETKGRRGKGVTIISDLPLNEVQLRDLAGRLKQNCGTGGTVKDGEIEIQGDQRERIIAELEKLDFTVKRSGG